MVGETLCNVHEEVKINGISISLKKKLFCILKIWVDNCKYNDISIFNNLNNILSYNFIF